MRLAPLAVFLVVFASACDIDTRPHHGDAGPQTLSDAGSSSTDAGPASVADHVDRDGDGLDEADERAHGTDPTREDSDGDGVPDGVEVLAGTDPLDAASTIPATDYYVVLPYEAPPQTRELGFTARLGRGDIVFLVDTTGSMHDPIANVRNSLSRVIVPRIEDAFADPWIGVVEFQDFPVSPYGGPGDVPYRVRQAPTPDTSAVQDALEALTLGDGGDLPESLLEGVHAIATSGFTRSDARTIIVAITDADGHNVPGSLPTGTSSSTRSATTRRSPRCEAPTSDSWVSRSPRSAGTCSRATTSKRSRATRARSSTARRASTTRRVAG